MVTKVKTQKGLFIILSALMLYISGCASAPSVPIRGLEKAPPPSVTFGPEIEVLKNVSRFSVVIDQNGMAHFLGEAEGTKELEHFVVGREGIVEKNIVDSTPPQKEDSWFFKRVGVPMDSALDAEGNLHLLVDGRHYQFQDNMWQKQPPIPCQQFAKGGKDLICAYITGGKDVGAPGRWDWYMVAASGGMAAAGLIWPWYSHPDKLVIVSKDGTHWNVPVVIDPDTKMHAELFKVAADEKGNIHALYTRGRGMYGGEVSHVYIKHEVQKRPSEIQPKKGEIIKVDGQRINKNVMGINLFFAKDFDLAVDPVSGCCLLSALWASPSSITLPPYGPSYTEKELYLLNDGWRKTLLNIKITHPYSAVKYVPGGNDQFHVLVSTAGSIMYILCKGPECSASIALGEQNVRYSLASDGHGNALLLMTKENRRVSAKWITINKE
jgi:hypothetical protein